MFIQTIYKKIYYNSIDVSEDMDVNNTTASKECIICHYWYFLSKEVMFQSTVCNGCHNVSTMSIDIDSITILNIYGVDYCSVIKSYAINLLAIADLSEKSGPFYNKSSKNKEKLKEYVRNSDYSKVVTKI